MRWRQEHRFNHVLRDTSLKKWLATKKVVEVAKVHKGCDFKVRVPKQIWFTEQKENRNVRKSTISAYRVQHGLDPNPDVRQSSTPHIWKRK